MRVRLIARAIAYNGSLAVIRTPVGGSGALYPCRLDEKGSIRVAELYLLFIFADK